MQLVKYNTPTDDGKSIELSSLFIEQVSGVIEKKSRSNDILIGGDINAKMGKCDNIMGKATKRSIGPFGKDKINERGFLW